MDLGIPFGVIIGYAVGLIVLYLAGWLLLVPLKMLLKFIYNGILGGIILWILNMVGGLIHVTIAINPITALIVGFLGVPGVILLLILQFLLI